MALVVRNWNTEWAKPGTERHQVIIERLNLNSCDLVCLTETFEASLPAPWNTISSHEDYGYRIRSGRRKVLLAARGAWNQVANYHDHDIPSGRIVSGVTETSIGPLNVVGVCIPWRDAHVRTGRSDRKLWEDHLHFVQGLSLILEARDEHLPTIVMGDFNQRIPKGRQPQYTYDALLEALGPGLTVATSGDIASCMKPGVDHLAHSSELRCTHVRAIDNYRPDGSRLSDHFGVEVAVSLA